MKKKKKKILSLILSISSISGFSIGAMKYSEGGLYDKPQTQIDSKNIGLPEEIYEKLCQLTSFDDTKSINLYDELNRWIKEVKNKAKILRAFEENTTLSDDDIRKFNLDDIEMQIASSYETFGDLYDLFSSSGFYVYYKLDKDKKISELGLICNYADGERIIILKNSRKVDFPRGLISAAIHGRASTKPIFEHKKNWTEYQNHEIHVMPVLMNRDK